MPSSLTCGAVLSTTTSRALTGAAPVAGTTATPVLDAGQVTVTVDGALLRIVSATPAAGWSVEVERDNAREIEVSFRSGSARVDFNAELEDNAIRIRIRDRRTEATNGSTTSTSTTVAGSGGGGTATVRTVQSAGGSVTVSQRGDSVTLVVATPATGFAADVRKSGPDTVEVRFTNGKRESRVELSIDNGTPRERVEDR